MIPGMPLYSQALMTAAQRPAGMGLTQIDRERQYQRPPPARVTQGPGRPMITMPLSYRPPTAAGVPQGPGQPLNPMSQSYRPGQSAGGARVNPMQGRGVGAVPGRGAGRPMMAIPQGMEVELSAVELSG
jgi:hypothetical protein